MTFNEFTKSAGINYDRHNFHAYVVEECGESVEMGEAEWWDLWFDYIAPTDDIPFDGSTPADVRDAEPVDEFEDSRDAAGV